MFLFWLDNILWQGTEWGPHLTNVIIHVINVYLIWLLVRFMRMGAKTQVSGVYGGIPAFAASLLYGLHPLAVGSVAWVGARFDVMSVTFGLLGLLMWFRWDAGFTGFRGLAGALLVLLAAFLSKEQGIVFIGACLLVSLVRLSQGIKRNRNLTGLAALGFLLVFYTVYRLFIFSGLGGYLTSQHGLNFAIPVYFFCAVLFPFLDNMHNGIFSLAFTVPVVIMIVITVVMWKPFTRNEGRIPLIFPLVAGAVFIIGLATTAPHAGMTLDQILKHAESRFALIPIVGLSLIAGIGLQVLVRAPLMHRAVLIVTLVLGMASVWRSDIQIGAWYSAGLTASSIINQTLELAPDPPPNSKLIFIDVPRNNDQYAYIFGIGLKEALIYKYGRQDINVIRYPTRRDLGTANPDRDFAFQYHVATGKLEKLTAVKREMK